MTADPTWKGMPLDAETALALLEWQRDWKNRETYDAVMDIVREHSGAYGMGVDYAYTMVHKAPARNRSEHEVLAPVAAN